MESHETRRDRSVDTLRGGFALGTACVLLALAGSPAGAQDGNPGDPNGADRNFDLEFSLDIGSDTELSDPFADGDEVFDPGDMYHWRGALFAGPVDGIWDDKFPYAPWLPTPEPGFLHPLGFPAAAPACVGFPMQEVRFEYLDVDASDSIDIPLWELINPHQPLEQPIPFMLTESIHFPKGVIISYDDDDAKPYADCDVPVTTLSPGGALYGTTAGRDEVIAYDFAMTLPLTPIAMRPVQSERELNPNLAPNPRPDQQEDDDVDALDITHVAQDGPRWPFWLWSADHEALGKVFSPMAVPDPGHIYWFDGFTMGTFIRADVHLGLRDGVDIDAFELIWLERPNGLVSLAAMFSVDDDDPTTPGVDESGGLDPAVLYGSFMMGGSFVLVEEPFRDDIDAVAAWCEALVQDPTWDGGVAPCPPDLAAPFGVLNFFDIAAYIMSFNASDPAADLAAPFGVWNFFDIAAYIASFNAGCP